MIDIEPRDRTVPGGTLRWGLTMTLRAWGYTALGVCATVITTAPLALFLAALSPFFSDSSVYFMALMLYAIVVVTLGIGVGGVLRRYKITIDLSELPQTPIPGDRRRDRPVGQADLMLIVMFLIAGYTLFSLAILGVATMAGLLGGPLAAAITVVVTIYGELILNRDHEKSFLVGFVSLARSAYERLSHPSFRRKQELEAMEQQAKILTQMPFRHSWNKS